MTTYNSACLALFLLFLNLSFFFKLLRAVCRKMPCLPTRVTNSFFILGYFIIPRIILLKIFKIIVVFFWTVGSKMSLLIAYKANKFFLRIILAVILIGVLVVFSFLQLRTLSCNMSWLFTMITNNHICCSWLHNCLIPRIYDQSLLILPRII